MAKTLTSILAGGLLSLATQAGAATINGDTNSLAGADVLLTFSEVAIADGSQVTNEFAAFGVTMGSQVFIDPPNSGGETIPNITGDRLANFNATTVFNPLTILFSTDVTAASVAVGTNTGTTLFEALLNGVLVESFSATTDLTSSANFFGFTGIVFDELRITGGGGNQAAAIDNLGYVTAIPLPAAGLLLIFGLAGLGVVSVRSRRRAA